MKIKRALSALAALLLLCAPARAAQTAVLAYMSGSDLESEAAYATEDLYEMQYAGLSAAGERTLLAMAGGAEEWAHEAMRGERAGLLRISESGAELLETRRARNMGSARTLEEFLAFGAEHAPAERYILVLWGHGSGPFGLCYDENYDDGLTLDELRSALQTAERRGQRIDAVIFDACSMGCADALYALDGLTDYAVMSQASTVGTGGRYNEWLAAPGENAREACLRFAQRYIETTRHGAFSDFSSISVLDVSRAGRMRAAVEALCAELSAALDRDSGAVLDALEALWPESYVDDDGMFDARAVCDAFEEIAPAACAALRTELERAVLLNEVSGMPEGALCGLSIVLPGPDAELNDALRELYLPRMRDSAHARLVVQLSTALRGRTKGGGLFGLLGDLLGGLSADSPDYTQIWQGLRPSA